MSTGQTNEPTSRKPLRLWPGIVAVVLLWLARFGLKAVIPGFRGFSLGMQWALGAAVAVLLWWLFFSRARWFERLGAIVVMIAGLAGTLSEEMERMQRELFEAAKARRDRNTLRHPKSRDEFLQFLDGNGGFVFAGFSGDPAVEAEIKEETKATIRVLPDPEFQSPDPPKQCIWTGRPAVVEAVWGKAY